MDAAAVEVRIAGSFVVDGEVRVVAVAAVVAGGGGVGGVAAAVVAEVAGVDVAEMQKSWWVRSAAVAVVCSGGTATE